MKNIVFVLIAFLTIGNLSAQVDRSKMPEPGPAPEIKLGETESFTLDNGLKVFVVENHKLPKVTFSLIVDYDPFVEGDITGNAELAGDLLSKGTTSRTADQISSEVDFIGARFNTSANSVYASSLTKHQEKILEIMADVVKNPKFSQEELDKLKKQYQSNIAATVNDPDAIASNVRRAVIYGKDHPYGEIMTEESIDNIELKDIQDFYSTYFRPNVSYLAVVGDVKTKNIKKLVKKYFGDWKKGEVPTSDFETPKKPESPKVIFVNKPGAVQSVISVTYPIQMKNASPDKIKADVMNTILGGGFTSKLNLNLREKNAFTYGARSSLNADELVGYFNATAKVRNEVTDSAIAETFKELQGVLAGNITEDELQTIKNYSTGIFAYSLENPQTKARFAINIARYGLSEDYYEDYLQNLSDVSLEDVNEMAQKYITPANAYIIVVGNKEEVADKLKKFTLQDITYLDAFGDEVKETLEAVPSGVNEKTVIDSYIKALGGEKAMKNIKNSHMVMTTTMQGMPIKIETYTESPNKFSQKVSSGEMVINQQIFDGNKGKTAGMQGEKEMSEEELKDMKVEAILFPELQYEQLGFKTTLKGVDDFKGEKVYVLEVEKPSGEKETDYYSVESGLLLKTVATTESPMGAIQQEQVFSDYKEVNGVKYPHKIIQTVGPQKMDMSVETIEFNKKAPAGTFEVK